MSGEAPAHLGSLHTLSWEKSLPQLQRFFVWMRVPKDVCMHVRRCCCSAASRTFLAQSRYAAVDVVPPSGLLKGG